MTTERDYLDTIKETVKDDSIIVTPLQIRQHLRNSIKQYQKVRPREMVWDIPGDDTTVDFDLPSDWVDRFSIIIKIEYPLQTTGRPTFLTSHNWQILQKAAGKVLRFYSALASSQTARVTYAIPHTVDATTDTIDSFDFDAVCDLAASRCCGSLARYYSQTSNPTLNADVVDYRDKARLYSEMEKTLLEGYRDHVKEIAEAIGQWDMTPSWGDEDSSFLFKGDTR